MKRAAALASTILVAAGALPGGMAAAAGERLFDSPIALSLGAAANDVLLEDFDGDGRTDVALALPDLTAVAVGRGLAGPPYLAEVTAHAVGLNPIALAAGELGGAGRLDLVVANAGSASVSVLLGQPDGTFSPAGDVETGPGPRFVGLADLDQDGQLDMVTTDFINVNAGSLGIFLGSGQGGFTRRAAVNLGDNAHGFALADFDADGLQDVALGYREDSNQQGMIVWLRGNGDGTLATGVRAVLDAALGQIPRFFAAIDRGGELRTQLVVLTDQGKLFLLELGTGGRFAPRLVVESQSPSTLEVADLDADGRLDVVTASAATVEPPILLHAGDAAGGFRPLVEVPLGIPRWSGLGLADLDGDALVDVGAATQSTDSGVLTLLLADGAARFQWREAVDLGVGPRALAPVPAADGREELLVLSSHALHLVRAVNPGGGEAQVLRSYPGAALGDFIALDLDLDGSPDVAMTDVPRGRLLVIDPAGPPGAGEIDREAGRVPGRLTAGDFDGDGLQDLVLADLASAMVKVFSRPKAVDAPPHREVDVGGPQRAVSVGDLDGDGRLDLVVGLRGGLQILEGDGAGGFAAPGELFGAMNAADVRIADLDADGDADILAAAAEGLLVYLDPGSFSPGRETRLGEGSFIAVAALDIDGDGHGDVAGASREQVVVWRGSDGGLAPPEQYFAGSSLSRLAFADLDGDGRLEGAAADASGRAVTLLRSVRVAPAPVFRRGDADGSGDAALTDPLTILRWLFQDGAAPACLDAADADDDGQLALTDAVTVLLYLYLGGAAPPSPGPLECGLDITPDTLDCTEACNEG